MCAETSMDCMYLDNLDEYINDEGKIITCKWLCLTLKVHVNIAKQMLYHYVTKCRSEDKGDDLCVIYLVSGIVAGKNDQPDIQKVVLVREENLDVVKSTMKTIISVHIYSISKSKPKDLSVLYTTNKDEVKKNLTSIKSYGGIECSSAKVRSQADLAKLQQQNAYRDPEEAAAPVKKQKAEEKVKEESKPETKTIKPTKKQSNQIASMFARQSVKSDVKQDEKKDSTSSNKSSSAGSKKNGGISAFFNKAPVPKESQKTPDLSKSSPVKNESPATKTPVKSESDNSSLADSESVMSSGKTESQDSVSKVSPLDKMEVDSSPPKKTKSKKQSVVKPKKPNQKRGKVKCSDDESPIPKRKRIMQLSDSDSSSEEENEEEESPIPDPSRIESDEEEVMSSPPKPEPKEQQYSQSGKAKKRKLVSKTFEDEDGFFVTKKEYVYVTDSEEEVEVTKSNQENIPEKGNSNSPRKSAGIPSPKKVTNETSPQKKTAKSPVKKRSKDLVKTKQSSIMSFFSKK